MRFRITGPMQTDIARFAAHPTVVAAMRAFPGSVIMTPAETDMSKDPRYMVDKSKGETEALYAVIPSLGEFMEDTFGSAEGTVYDFGELAPEKLDELVECILFSYFDAVPVELRLTEADLFTKITEQKDGCVNIIGEVMEGTFGDAEGTVYDMGTMEEEELKDLIEAVVDTFQEGVWASAEARQRPLDAVDDDAIPF